MSFKFSLRSVLKVRRIEEERQRKALALVLQKKQQLLDQKEHYSNEIFTYNAQEKGISGGVRRFQQHADFLHQKHNGIHQMEAQIEQTERHEMEERHKLVERNRATKVLKNLEHRHKIAFLKEEDRKEQRLLNDLATIQFNRKRKGL